MQLIDTRISNFKEGTLTVEFHGEGNELVSVRMATDGPLDSARAVGRAKEMMVQLAAFESESDPLTTAERESQGSSPSPGTAA